MKPQHISWLNNTGVSLQTSDGKTVEVWELCHNPCNTILSAWAKHFREHYCKDSEIDSLRQGTPYSRKSYLEQIKFPDKTNAPGPSTRAGDFGEILVSDFLEFIETYEVLSRHTRYSNKTNRNESTKGSDVIGFRFVNYPNTDLHDELAIFEAKAKFSGDTCSAKERLQNAIDDSAKDKLRIAESLNAMKQRFIDKGLLLEKSKVERFQNEADTPYKTLSGAVALVCNSNYSADIAVNSNSLNHPNKANLRLIVIKGENMMTLVHELYKMAANES